MWAVLLTILITYIVTSLFGYVVHWALHQTWAGQFNNAHMTHHLKLYPPEDYTSETYRNAGKDSTPKFFAMAALPLIALPIVLWAVGFIPISLMVIDTCKELRYELCSRCCFGCWCPCRWLCCCPSCLGLAQEQVLKITA